MKKLEVPSLEEVQARHARELQEVEILTQMQSCQERMTELQKKLDALRISPKKPQGEKPKRTYKPREKKEVSVEKIPSSAEVPITP